MSKNLVDKKCVSTEWFTPPEILEPVRELFGGTIAFDPCTTPGNPVGALNFCANTRSTSFCANTRTYTYNDDGLSAVWCDRTFVNPPYGKALYSWIDKTVVEASYGYRIVLIVSASSRWDQPRWQRIYSPNLTTMVIPIGRVKFMNAAGERCKSPPYPSLLFFYNIEPKDVYRCFGEIGTVVKQEIVS